MARRGDTRIEVKLGARVKETGYKTAIMTVEGPLTDILNDKYNTLVLQKGRCMNRISDTLSTKSCPVVENLGLWKIHNILGT